MSIFRSLFLVFDILDCTLWPIIIWVNPINATLSWFYFTGVCIDSSFQLFFMYSLRYLWIRIFVMMRGVWEFWNVQRIGMTWIIVVVVAQSFWTFIKTFLKSSLLPFPTRFMHWVVMTFFTLVTRWTYWVLLLCPFFMSFLSIYWSVIVLFGLLIRHSLKILKTISLCGTPCKNSSLFFLRRERRML